MHQYQSSEQTKQLLCSHQIPSQESHKHSEKSSNKKYKDNFRQSRGNARPYLKNYDDKIMQIKIHKNLKKHRRDNYKLVPYKQLSNSQEEKFTLEKYSFAIDFQNLTQLPPLLQRRTTLLISLGSSCKFKNKQFYALSFLGGEHHFVVNVQILLKLNKNLSLDPLPIAVIQSIEIRRDINNSKKKTINTIRFYSPQPFSLKQAIQPDKKVVNKARSC